MFSRATSQHAIEEERIEKVEADRANHRSVMRKQVSDDNASDSAAYGRGGTRLSDKHSIVSGRSFLDKTGFYFRQNIHRFYILNAFC